MKSERRLYIVVLFVYAAVCGEATAASTHSHSPTRHTLTLGQDSLVSLFDAQGPPFSVGFRHTGYSVALNKKPRHQYADTKGMRVLWL